MSASTTKKVLKYVVLPGIIPRAKRLFSSGFGYLAFLMAQIYGIVRLLPANHPYLNPQNIGGFGLKHVVAEAANHLVISRKNIDQLVIFGALLAGIVIFLLQFVFLAYTMFIGPAMAQTAAATGLSIFSTSAPTFDIAHIMLDRVFGIPDMFNSCVSQGIACTENGPAFDKIPWPIHDALHGLFQFYSYGLLVIGLLIFLYFVIVVVAETATTGTPFGQRFQNVWVPIRLVMAIGLLVPISHGLNSAQYIVLQAAKMGSGFATNGWLTFNAQTSAAAQKYAADPFGSAAIKDGNPTGETNETLIGYPSTPDISAIYQAMSLIHTCAYTEWVKANQGSVFSQRANQDQDTRLSHSGGSSGIDVAHMDEEFLKVKPYFVKYFGNKDHPETQKRVEFGTAIEEALAFSGNSNITIVFGEWDSTEKAPYKGNVKPICGEMRIPVTTVPETDQNGQPVGPPGVTKVYYDLVRTLWFGTDQHTPARNPLFQFAARHAGLHFVRNLDGASIACSIGCKDGDLLPSCSLAGTNGRPACLTSPANETWRNNKLDITRNEIRGALRKNYNEYLQSLTELDIEKEVLKRGWGGAGMWYNHIAELNGSYVTATQALPELRKFPKTMEDIRKEKNKIDESTSSETEFDPAFITNLGATSSAQIDLYQGETLNKAYQFWKESSGEDKKTGNIFEDTMSVIFGVDAMFKMRTENAQLHPLAQLSLLGKGMVESTIRNIMLSSGLGIASGLTAIFGGGFAKIGLDTLSGFLFSTAFMGLTAGLVLYYVLPFMPFLYFFFAVSNWVKEIFEAMVGAPLWALAHIRIDGEGLPGDAASNGYMLILSIILRPIAIVFGLIAAIIIFGAQVRILNIIWDLVVHNVAGNHGSESTVNIVGDFVTLERKVIDQFFFTVIYTIIVYMLANASFKLIDNIPNDLMRWMSSGVTSFSDMQQTPAEGLQRYVASGGLVQGQELAGAINSSSKQLGGQLGNILGANSRAGNTGQIPPGAQ